MSQTHPSHIRRVGICEYVPHEDTFRCLVCDSPSRRMKKRNCPAKFDPDSRTDEGVGNELERILHSFGIFPVDGCGCDNLRAALNAMGPDKCSACLDDIATRLQRQASARGWLMSRSAITHQIAKGVVSLAITNARKREQSNG